MATSDKINVLVVAQKLPGSDLPFPNSPKQKKKWIKISAASSALTQMEGSFGKSVFAYLLWCSLGEGARGLRLPPPSSQIDTWSLLISFGGQWASG